MTNSSEHDGWPGDEATEPEGATFVASNPYIRLDSRETHANPVWASARGPRTSYDGSAVFTSARTVLLDESCDSGAVDVSLFEDVTEPGYTGLSATDPEGQAVRR